jgi:hypothetical protein
LATGFQPALHLLQLGPRFLSVLTLFPPLTHFDNGSLLDFEQCARYAMVHAPFLHEHWVIAPSTSSVSEAVDSKPADRVIRIRHRPLLDYPVHRLVEDVQFF